MSKKTTTGKIQSDGTIVEVLGDGTERPFPDMPMRSMTEAEIEAAALADPDARHDNRRTTDGAPCAAHQDVAPGARADAGEIRRALPRSARFATGSRGAPSRINRPVPISKRLQAIRRRCSARLKSAIPDSRIIFAEPTSVIEEAYVSTTKASSKSPR